MFWVVKVHFAVGVIASYCVEDEVAKLSWLDDLLLHVLDDRLLCISGAARFVTFLLVTLKVELVET